MNSTKDCSRLGRSAGTATWQTAYKHNVMLEWPHGMKTWCHLQNWKYITYRNAVGVGPKHGHMQHAQKLVKFSHVVFELCERTDKQTYSSQYFGINEQQWISYCSSCAMTVWTFLCAIRYVDVVATASGGAGWRQWRPSTAPGQQIRGNPSRHRRRTGQMLNVNLTSQSMPQWDRLHLGLQSYQPTLNCS